MANDTASGSPSWFQSIPPVTRFILSCIVLIIGLWKLSIISLDHFLFSWYDVMNKFQLYRVFTSSIMIIPGSATQALATILEFYNLYSRSVYLETGHFRGEVATYSYYLACCMLMIAMTCSLWFRNAKEQFVLQSAFTGCMGYTWAMDHLETQVLYYGVLPIKGKYQPIVEMLISFVFNGGDNGFQLCVIGVCTGYLYHCVDTKSLGPLHWWLTQKSPSAYPYGYFKPPRWFLSLFQQLDGTRVNTFAGKGRKLGSSKGSAKSVPITIVQEANEDKSAAKTASTTAEKRAFYGKGQKLGK